MYEAFRIASVHGRTGKDLLHVEFMDAPDGTAFVIHPERLAPHPLELRLLGEAFDVEDAAAGRHFTAGQLRRYHELDEAEAERLSREQDAPAYPLLSGARIRAAWSSTRLTFIKRLIEPLEPDDLFVVNVSGQAVYAMSRREFEETFSNVVESVAYADYGSYNYKQTPQKAERFIVA